MWESDTPMKLKAPQGFTFIEVLIAMLIFVFVVLAAVNIASGSVRATRDAKEISKATWLLQNVMTELETKLEVEGIEKACDKKKEGKFDGLNEGYTWATFCYEIDLKLSQTASAVQASQNADQGDSNTSKEDIMQKLILDTASEYIDKSFREIHAEVYWMQGKTKKTVSLTTHFVRYDLPISMPGGGLKSTQPTSPSGSGGGT